MKFDLEEKRNKSQFLLDKLKKNKYVIIYILTIIFSLSILTSIFFELRERLNVNSNEKIIKIAGVCAQKICINNTYCFENFPTSKEVIIYKEKENFINSNGWIINIKVESINCGSGKLSDNGISLERRKYGKWNLH